MPPKRRGRLGGYSRHLSLAPGIHGRDEPFSPDGVAPESRRARALRR